MSKERRAVVLLSGGLDSATVLYMAIKEGFACTALAFDYGQRHRRELKAAERIAESAGCELKRVKFTFPHKASSLLDRTENLPEPSGLSEILSRVPSTYVPARNIIFLSFGVSLAEAIDGEEVFIGANSVDYSGYPDCRPEFFEAFQKSVDTGTRAGNGRRIIIRTPILDMSKSDIIRKGIGLGVPYEHTWSCYRGERYPCRKCDSCKLREKAFLEAGVHDPALHGSGKG